jgi:hypothetical protein
MLLHQLWSDLGFVTSTKSCEYIIDSGGITGVQFSLTIQEDLVTTPVTSKNLPHSIRKYLCTDTLPPSGIRTVILSGIQIFLDFHSLASYVDVCLPIFPSTFRLIQEQRPPIETDDEHGAEMLDCSSCQLPSVLYTSIPFSHRRELLSLEELHIPNKKAANGISLHSTISNNEYNPGASDTIGELQGLLDFAIRNIISSNPSHAACKVEELNSGRALKLADIAPAVFSPGYRGVSSVCYIYS